MRGALLRMVCRGVRGVPSTLLFSKRALRKQCLQPNHELSRFS